MSMNLVAGPVTIWEIFWIYIDRIYDLRFWIYDLRFWISKTISKNKRDVVKVISINSLIC